MTRTQEPRTSLGMTGSAPHGLLTSESHVPSQLTGRQHPVLPQQGHTLVKGPTVEADCLGVIFYITAQPLNVSATSSVQRRWHIILSLIAWYTHSINIFTGSLGELVWSPNINNSYEAGRLLSSRPLSKIISNNSGSDFGITMYKRVYFTHRKLREKGNKFTEAKWSGQVHNS